MNNTNSPSVQELLSLEDAADFLCVSKSTMYRLLDQGKLGGMKAGKQWRFRKGDLMDYMQRGPAAFSLANVPTEVVEAELEFLAQELSREGASLEEVDGPEGAGEAGKIARIVRRMTWLLNARGGSDLHLEPVWEGGKDYSLLRLRLDGLLHEVRRFPRSLHEPLMLEWKRLAGLPPEEKPRPLEGNVQMTFGSVQVPLRISIVPTVYGEKLAVRPLPTSIPTLKALEVDDTPIKAWVRQPCGIIVIAGPTGCGKSTTMVACANELVSPVNNIMSLQDPPQYLLPGVTQIQIEGFSRADAMRAIQLQDPDVIVLGELPGDEELCQLTQQTASNGHLVLATMHSYDAVSCLYDFAGVKRSLLAASLIGIADQRLVRKLCKSCKAPVEPPAEFLSAVRKASAEGGFEVPEGTVFYGGKGCDACHGTGYYGRMAVYEFFTFTPALKAAFINGARPHELVKLARQEGFESRFASGVRRASEGATSLDEIIRVTPDWQDVLP